MEIASKEIKLDGSRIASFRPAVKEDEAFVLGLYESTRLEELALTNWDQPQKDAFVRMQFTAQQLHYRQQYPDGEHLIVLLDGLAIGRFYIANIGTEIRIIDITILPEHRSKGVGTQILRELMNEAKTLDLPLCIYVESFNPSLRLFERLGFERAGESGYSYLMKWSEPKTAKK
jgi:RimJ/RimL family protein N-acetyltransferase